MRLIEAYEARHLQLEMTLFNALVFAEIAQARECWREQRRAAETEKERKVFRSCHLLCNRRSISRDDPWRVL